MISRAMPVYHFTLHAYRSWRPDHKRGYTQRKKGYLPPDPEQARKYDERAREGPVVFTRDVQRVIIRTTADFCARRKFRFHGSGNDESHSHLLISWRGYSHWNEVMRRLKNILSLELNKCFNCKRQWFVRGGSRKRVSKVAHLNHLLDRYFPDHPGLFWREGQPIT
jgi:hypothetical protein